VEKGIRYRCMPRLRYPHRVRRLEPSYEGAFEPEAEKWTCPGVGSGCRGKVVPEGDTARGGEEAGKLNLNRSEEDDDEICDCKTERSPRNKSGVPFFLRNS